MAFNNKYSSWYSEFKRKAESKKVRYPYKIVTKINGIIKPISGLENEIEYAYSPAQARYLFLKKHTRLRDYLDMGYRVEVELDKEAMEADVQQKKQIAEMEAKRKQEIDEFVQNAWWND